MQAESAFEEANGLRLHYLAWGKRAAPPIVLVHATGFLAALWTPVAVRLAATHRVYAYDVRGHGDSDKPPSGYLWSNLVEDLRGFLDRAGIRPVALAGHSSGGATALYLAATQPAYVSSVFAYEPIVVPAEMASLGANPMVEAARKRRRAWPSVRDMVAAYRQRDTFSRWREDVLQLYAEHGTYPSEDSQVHLKCPPEIEAQVFENSASLDWNVLQDISCPVRLVAGGNTDAFLRAAVAAAAARIPGCQSETLEGAGHLAPMEDPDAIADMIANFLEEQS